MVTTMGEALGGNLATKAGLKAETDRLRTEMAQEFKALYQHLRVMAVGIVGLTVTLLKVLP